MDEKWDSTNERYRTHIWFNKKIKASLRWRNWSIYGRIGGFQSMRWPSRVFHFVYWFVKFENNIWIIHLKSGRNHWIRKIRSQWIRDINKWVTRFSLENQKKNISNYVQLFFKKDWRPYGSRRGFACK